MSLAEEITSANYVHPGCTTFVLPKPGIRSLREVLPIQVLPLCVTIPLPLTSKDTEGPMKLTRSR